MKTLLTKTIKKISLILVMGIILLITNPVKGQIFATLDSLSYTYGTTFSIFLRLVSGSDFIVHTSQTQNLNDTLKIDLCISNSFVAQPRLLDTVITLPIHPNDVPNHLMATIYTNEVGGDCANDTATQPYPYIINLGTGSKELPEAHNNISIYPNPSKGFFTLKLKEHLKISTITLYDIAGRVARIYNPSEKKLKTEGLSNGQYFLKIETEEGVITKRVQLE